MILTILAIKLTYSIAPAVLAAGITAAAGGANAYAQGKMNRQSRKFQEKMFDATNAYNSPLEQRKRLEAAGLNPNMVYGGSSGGTAGTASQPAKPDFDAPKFDGVAQGAMDFYNAKSIQSGIDVNDARIEQIKQQTTNAAIDQLNKSIRNASDSISLKTKNRLYENTIKTAEQNLENLGIAGKYQSDKNSRENRVTTETVSKLKQEIKNEKIKGSILSSESIMKRLDAALYKDYNIRPDDPFYAKVIGRIMSELNLKL